jgi:hypothetical protein
LEQLQLLLLMQLLMLVQLPLLLLLRLRLLVRLLLLLLLQLLSDALQSYLSPAYRVGAENWCHCTRPPARCGLCRRCTRPASLGTAQAVGGRRRRRMRRG